MKSTKFIKRVAAVALTLAMTASVILTNGIETEAAYNVELTRSTQVYDLVSQGYNGGVYGPIAITEGYMYSGWSWTPVYLVTLSGTEIVQNQSTGYWTDVLSGFNLNNAYVKDVVNAINSRCRRGSNLVLAGHSLGGMIAQQVAANDQIKRDYNVLNTVCFGSPLLSAGSREGDVKRLGDTSDVIPYMSGSLFNNTVWAVAGLNRENGGYNRNQLEKAHVESYARDDVWGAYDVVGYKWGNHRMVLDMNSRRFYSAPARLW